MKELHIAQVGELFGEESFDFLSNQNLHEYDFIIIDTQALIEEINGKHIKNVKKRFDNLYDFIKIKNIPVAFICSVEGSFALNGSDSTHTICQILELDVEEEPMGGRKIEINPNSSCADLLRKSDGNLEYVVGFKKHPGISIGNAKSKNLSIGFYTKDFLFLPTFNEDCNVDDQIFLKDLYSVCQSIRKDEDIIVMPSWTDKYFLPNEKDQRRDLEEIEESIMQLQKKKVTIQLLLTSHLSIKQLWIGSGQVLENAVREVFKELGFLILHTVPGRDDIIMDWKGKIVVVEVKGQTKSAAEKNAAQLEKWVSTYYASEGIMPKGLLIVNTFRETLLKNRTQPSFPDQMLPYSHSRGHCLLTTLQLCCLLLFCRANPKQKESEIKKLLDNVGRYNNYTDWENYISSNNDDANDSKKRPANKLSKVK